MVGVSKVQDHTDCRTVGPPWLHSEHLAVSLPLNLTPEISTSSCSAGSTSSPSPPAPAEGGFCSSRYFCRSNRHPQGEPDRLPGQRLFSGRDAGVGARPARCALCSRFNPRLASGTRRLLPAGAGSGKEGKKEGWARCMALIAHRLLSGPDLGRCCGQPTALCQDSVREA